MIFFRYFATLQWIGTTFLELSKKNKIDVHCNVIKILVIDEFCGGGSNEALVFIMITLKY